MLSGVQRERDSGEPEEIRSALRGIGLLLMSIDARLAAVVILLGGDDEEADA
jgi:hypothetical protein